VHFEIRSDDPTRPGVFGDLFGMDLSRGAFPGYSFVETGAQTFRVDRPAPGGSEMVTFFVGVDDIEASLAAAKKLGGPRRAGSGWRARVTFALIADRSPCCRSRQQG